ncbi:hypothetical protein SAMN05428949_7302 [Chitinophaga sp. YR627]|nr:hypothetical protein SAMN05428949_7302 [Chitinophaga sp. YR627]
MLAILNITQNKISISFISVKNTLVKPAYDIQHISYMSIRNVYTLAPISSKNSQTAVRG